MPYYLPVHTQQVGHLGDLAYDYSVSWQSDSPVATDHVSCFSLSNHWLCRYRFLWQFSSLSYSGYPPSSNPFTPVPSDINIREAGHEYFAAYYEDTRKAKVTEPDQPLVQVHRFKAMSYMMKVKATAPIERNAPLHLWFPSLVSPSSLEPLHCISTFPSRLKTRCILCGFVGLAIENYLYPAAKRLKTFDMRQPCIRSMLLWTSSF